ncbi:hypothetical protein MMVgp2 [Minute virus of mice]|uniref:Uncharacterized protein n=3 Tax=Murine minute virus TaxID=10794 RepID=Q76W03_MUMIP|nr:hypothetical protein MMVgp2 [Minute virus of mice]AAA67113.1 unknown protein [Minute virus of mice]AAA69571.1 unknown protein [Minute virus of mice]CAA24312.1 unnamed protein product [Minute virus of mice]
MFNYLFYRPEITWF